MSNKRKSSHGRGALKRQQRSGVAHRAPSPSVSAGAAIALGLGLSAGEARAATFEVTTLADSGAGSLRAAVEAANAAMGADVITFQSGLTGTITLSGAQLVIEDNLEIQGPGASALSVSGNNAHRVFYISQYTADLEVAISGLTITGGSVSTHGGGIVSSAARLLLDAVEISGNIAGPQTSGQGGGLWAEKAAMGITIQNSVITDNAARQGGGAFFGSLDGTLDVVASRISSNSGDEAAGIWIDEATKPVTVDQTTLSENMSQGSGGALRLRTTGTDATLMIRSSTISGNGASLGGALALQDIRAPVAIENSTISGNHATDSGAIYCYSCGTLGIRHATISGNAATGSGAIIHLETGLAVLSHSIIADNTTAGDDLAGDGDFSADHTLIENPGATTLTDGGGNVLGQDPQLGPLQDNGGASFTQLPAATSPAIDAGNPNIASPPIYDQRGRARIVNGRIDIGAVERNSGTLQCSAADLSVAESAGDVTLMVTRTGGTDGDVSVDYATANGTATAPGDYASANGTLHWSNGEGSAKSVQVSIVDDQHAESSETFTATLSNATGAALGTVTSATLTITDDDAAPTLTAIGDQTVVAGGSTSPIAFTIGDADDSAATLTVSAISSNHTIVADAGVAFGGSAENRTLTITALTGGGGESTVTVSVSDGTNVATRSFKITVSASPGSESGQGTGGNLDAGTPGMNLDAGEGGGQMSDAAGGEDTDSATAAADTDSATAAADAAADSGAENGADSSAGAPSSDSGSNCGCDVPGRGTSAPKPLIAGLLGFAGIALRRRRRSAARG